MEIFYYQLDIIVCNKKLTLFPIILAESAKIAKIVISVENTGEK